MFHSKINWHERLLQDSDQSLVLCGCQWRIWRVWVVFEGFQFQHVGVEIVQMFLQRRSQFLIAACHQSAVLILKLRLSSEHMNINCWLLFTELLHFTKQRAASSNYISLKQTADSKASVSKQRPRSAGPETVLLPGLLQQQRQDHSLSPVSLWSKHIRSVIVWGIQTLLTWATIKFYFLTGVSKSLFTEAVP